MTRENRGAQWEVHGEENTYQDGSGWEIGNIFEELKISVILHHNFHNFA